MTLGARAWRKALWVAAALPLAAVAQATSFDQAFDDRGEPRALHYTVVFSAAGQEHALEVWRDGEERLRRRTDDALEIYVSRTAGDPEFQMSILDLRRRVHTRIDRRNLYRIGSFTDWFDLAHGLKHPKGAYQLTRARRPEGAPAAQGTCRWFDLSQVRGTVHICWSSEDRLPLLIEDERGSVVWRVTSVERGPIPAGAFEIHDQGFARDDANGDLGGD